MKKTLTVFLFLFIVSFLFPKSVVFAVEENEIEIKQEESKKILQSFQKEIKINRFVNADILTSEESAISVIIGKALEVDLAEYLLYEVPKDMVKDVLGVSVNLARILLGDETAIAEVLKEIEKKTVDAAKDYAIDWLLQNEIKVGNGNLDLTYPGIDRKPHKAIFSYIIEKKPIDLKNSEVVIEFYSPETIKAPALIAGYQWEGGIENIPPFILRAKGEVLKTDLGAYRWIKGPEIEIIFNEPVPKIELEEKGLLQGWMDKVTSWAEDARRVIDFFTGLFRQLGGKIKEESLSIWDKAGGFFASINFFTAKVAPDIGYFNDFEEIFEEFEELNQEIGQNVSEQVEKSLAPMPIGRQAPSTPSLEEMQDMIDDITEQIDILNQKLIELKPKEELILEELVLAEVSVVEEDKEEAEIAVFIPPTSTNSRFMVGVGGGGGGGSDGSSEPSWCSISGDPVMDKVIFSEIAWMGDLESSSNEWIKIKNISSSSINLENWQIFDKVKQIKKSFGSDVIINAGGFYLIERTKDYTGALNDTNEALYLFNSDCKLQDFVEANPDWPAGDKDNKETMKRKDDFTWYDYLDEELEPEPEPEPELEPEPGSEGEIPSHLVLINEVAWMGTKSSSSDEWIELFNPSSDPIDLSGWQLIFMPLVGDPRIIALDVDSPSIEAVNYFLLERTDDITISDMSADYIYTGALNDECKSLELRDKNDNLIDKINCVEEKWPAGSKEEGRVSMERASVDNWYSNNLIIQNGKDADGNDIWGTPKSQNSVSISPTEIIKQLPFDEFNEITLSLISAPYIVKEGLIVPEGKTLIIEPGVVLEFFEEYDGLIVGGSLKAIGEEQNNILFTSFQENPSPGDWDKIHFTNTSLESELDNVIVEYAGGGFGTPCSPDMAGIKIEGTDSILVKNSIFRHNQARGVYILNSSGVFDNILVENNIFCSSSAYDYEGYGISVEGGSPKIQNSLIKNNPIGIVVLDNTFPIIENNVFEQNEKPIWVYNGYPYFSENQAENNNINGVCVYGNINQNTSWQANLPYILEKRITVFEGNTLTLEPGAIVQFYDKNSGLAIEGNLKAIGEEQNNILFTSFQENPSPGDWDKIHFTNTSLESELDNVIVEYAGGGFGTPCSPDMAGIMVEGGLFSLKNSVIQNNQYNGIKLIESDSILNSVVINNTTACVASSNYGGFGAYIQGGDPNLEDLSFENNFNCNLYMNSICYPELPLILPTETPSNNP